MAILETLQKAAEKIFHFGHTHNIYCINKFFDIVNSHRLMENGTTISERPSAISKNMPPSYQFSPNKAGKMFLMSN